MVQRGQSKKELFDTIRAMAASPNAAPIEGKLRGYAAKLWNQAEAEERTWQGVSTNDRLDKAFEFLQQSGIFSAQDYWCCSSCGHTAAAESMTEQKTRGYVFYHEQDTDRAIDGGGLMLAYGSYEGEDEKTTAIAREIGSALDRFGVPYEWNGSPDSRIFILPFEWRKRRTTQAPPIPPGGRGEVIARKTVEPSETAPGEGAPLAEPSVDARLKHPDGRVWSAIISERLLTLIIRDADGDEFMRGVSCIDPRAELDSRIAELIADGFVKE
ncbi:MAG TPA: hypothetical protein PKA58_32525 [Polyangium sp.]|nr:hypothetical protein [Polyangium sp.]